MSTAALVAAVPAANASSPTDAAASAQAETTCSSWVTSLSIAVELTRNGATASVGDNQNTFSSSISVDTAAPCAEGSWVAHADGDIIYPPLFWPPSDDISVQSRALPVSICRN
ncbi:hypothetical protein ACFY4I_19955 [Streptomyces scabiei]|uniref:hypothetical protein n=1 Tax=Streptomyces scabiei TaxID=1930 RepID=UPI00368F29C9